MGPTAADPSSSSSRWVRQGDGGWVKNSEGGGAGPLVAAPTVDHVPKPAPPAPAVAGAGDPLGSSGGTRAVGADCTAAADGTAALARRPRGAAASWVPAPAAAPAAGSGQSSVDQMAEDAGGPAPRAPRDAWMGGPRCGVCGAGRRRGPRGPACPPAVAAAVAAAPGAAADAAAGARDEAPAVRPAAAAEMAADGGPPEAAAPGAAAGAAAGPACSWEAAWPGLRGWRPDWDTASDPGSGDFWDDSEDAQNYSE